VVSRTQQQFIVGVVAVVWLVLALLAGQAMTPTPLKLYSVAGTVVTLFVLAVDRYLWRFRIVRRFTGMPSLAGTWRGTLTSSFEVSPGVASPPIPIAILITQTASRMTATLFSADSSSVSQRVQLEQRSDGRWSLVWLYENTPFQAVRTRTGRHTGAAELTVEGELGDSLRGSYFTDRLCPFRGGRDLRGSGSDRVTRGCGA
jgi:hypothetical protein